MVTRSQRLASCSTPEPPPQEKRGRQRWRGGWGVYGERVRGRRAKTQTSVLLTGVDPKLDGGTCFLLFEFEVHGCLRVQRQEKDKVKYKVMKYSPQEDLNNMDQDKDYNISFHGCELDLFKRCAAF